MTDGLRHTVWLCRRWEIAIYCGNFRSNLVENVVNMERRVEWRCQWSDSILQWGVDMVRAKRMNCLGKRQRSIRRRVEKAESRAESVDRHFRIFYEHVVWVDRVPGRLDAAAHGTSPALRVESIHVEMRRGECSRDIHVRIQK
ncbi:hypothetical protein H257_07831 [Aphanomyces astaci]|uniref:Uncharacterized protein n=1 Tax=Aphanomyces astaci TaxID=112090 RepID=W4GIH4_APHAT|nr:hypothetical protein H257_07831 [Aphanomyces astaci]ETV79081.1 hypothetical protein H257_07831 [Aphanomyces astaci]|eukprot:XP_009831800.1 hypothetical protein H257_07831 [Aphanomyces astaci]